MACSFDYFLRILSYIDNINIYVYWYYIKIFCDKFNIRSYVFLQLMILYRISVKGV